MASTRCCVARLAAVTLVWACVIVESSDAVSFDQAIGTTSGAIAGRVTDATGAAVSGVSVGLSGPALMGPRITTTGPDGHYLLTALPPGDYDVTFERSGFRRVSSGSVRVGAGFTVPLDAKLEVAGFTETVSVEKRSGVIDRHSTAIIANFDATQLARMPGSRSLFAILSSTPGIQVQRFEVGGNTGDAGAPYSAYGTRGMNRPMVEGIVVTNIFPTGFTLDFGAFEEVSVGLGAHGPEWPLPGVQMQLVAKSGGNEYHGLLYGDFQHRDWQSFNIDAGQQQRALTSGAAPLSREANRLWQSYDLNADLGGFIAKDRAWWFGSVRDHDVQIRQVNYPVRPSRTRLTNSTVKATYSINPRHRLIAFAQTARNYQPNRLDPFGPTGAMTFNLANAIHRSDEATSRQRGSGIIWKGEWNAALLNDRAYLETRVGQFAVTRALTPNGSAPRFEDIDTLQVEGGGRTTEHVLRRTQFHSSLNYFLDHWTGGHQVKVGVEALETVMQDRVDRSFPGDVLHVLKGGLPSEVYLFLAPSDSSSGLLSVAAHAGDMWRVDDRLTLNLGLRFDRYRVFLPEQVHPRAGSDGGPVTFPAAAVLTWNRVAPRVGATFDLLGDGTTIVKASYGRYSLAPGDLGPNVNANAAEWWRRYRWDDSDGDEVWAPGEEGPERDFRGGVARESIDPSLRRPTMDELAGSVERELRAGLGLRTAVVWRRDARRYARQNAARPFEAFSEPIVIPDPGPDGRAGSADDGAAITGYNLHVDPDSPLPSAGNSVRTVENSGSRYVTWDVALSRRPRNGWWVSAGLAHTWHAEHGNAFTGQVIRQNIYVLTPNDLINTIAGRHAFRTWTAIVSGSFEAPWRVTISPLIRHQSGQPFGRTISADMNFGTIRILAEPLSARRMDNVTLTDLRIERDVIRSGTRRAALFVDVFNLLNANPEQNINWSSGSGFLQPLNVVAPRIIRIGAKASF